MVNLTSAKAQQPINELNNLWWAAAVIIVFMGVPVFSQSWIAGLMLVALGVVVTPVAFAHILSRLSAKDPLQIRVAIVLVGLIGSTYVLFEHSARVEAEAAEVARLEAAADARAAEEKRAADAASQLKEAQEYFAAHRDAVLAEFGNAIESKNMPIATVIRNRFIAAIRDPGFDQLLLRYNGVKDELAKAEADKARKAKITELTGKLPSVGATDYAQAKTIYAELVALDPSNKTYQQKLERFTKARDAQVAKEAAKIAADLEKAEHQKKIEAQFSGWDGSHRQFERLIKDAMNDPGSYEHVETKYIDKGSYIRVFCTFRGKNAFGGIVKNTKIADFDLNGNFLKEVQ